MLEVSETGGVFVIRMAHGKANALDLELCEAVASQFAAPEMRAAGAIVLTGTGHIFSAGVDLVRVVDGGERYVRAFLPALSAACEALFACPRPLVAAVNGHAIAGGGIFACAADYRLMAQGGGRIGIPELLVGVPFPVVPLEIVRFGVPAQHHPSIVYRGATLPPDAARDHGLIDALVDPDRLLDEAVAVARSLAAMPARSFELTKQQLRAPARQRMHDGAAVDREVADAWASPEVLRAIADYVGRVLKR